MLSFQTPPPFLSTNGDLFSCSNWSNRAKAQHIYMHTPQLRFVCALLQVCQHISSFLFQSVRYWLRSHVVDAATLPNRPPLLPLHPVEHQSKGPLALIHQQGLQHLKELTLIIRQLPPPPHPPSVTQQRKITLPEALLPIHPKVEKDEEDLLALPQSPNTPPDRKQETENSVDHCNLLVIMQSVHCSPSIPDSRYWRTPGNSTPKILPFHPTHLQCHLHPHTKVSRLQPDYPSCLLLSNVHLIPEFANISENLRGKILEGKDNNPVTLITPWPECDKAVASGKNITVIFLFNDPPLGQRSVHWRVPHSFRDL